MSFFNTLSNATKISVLQSSRDQLSTELTAILLRHGIDPEVFDFTDEAALDNYEMAGDIVRVEQICAGLQIIVSKLTALGA
jgi:hypothetical protein